MEYMERFEAAMRCEFSTKTSSSRDERSLQEDIGSFGQEPDETLGSYYGKTKEPGRTFQRRN